MVTTTLTVCPFCNTPAEDPCDDTCPDLASWRNPTPSLGEAWGIAYGTLIEAPKQPERVNRWWELFHFKVKPHATLLAASGMPIARFVATVSETVSP